MGVFDLNPVEEIEGNPPVFRIFCSLDDYRVNEETDKVTHGILKKDTTPPTQEFIQQCVDEMCGPTQIKIKDVVWSSYFTINERMANGFRRGRAFLIGGKVINISESIIALTFVQQMLLIATLLLVDKV